MDYLWTPWRYTYVTTAGTKTGECIFCAAVADPEHDREHLVVYRAAHNFVILNRFPYTSGHLMVVPNEHVATLTDLGDQTLFELIGLARNAEKHLREVYRPDGLNLGFNLGRSAGAGIAAHLHMHVLPRWTGDTSFISTVSETRVLPEDLDVTWERLRAAFSGE
ncbi:MAG TPA: HIT domain-containing protein [Bryobacteraceae bacterium]|jgi:ATP adenylyltransferase